MAGEMAGRIGARIRERRVELGMKQRELADLLGGDAIDNQRVSDWERGVNRPSDRYMEKLAAALERDVSWFYREDGATPDLSLVKPDLEDTIAGMLGDLRDVLREVTEQLAEQTAVLKEIRAASERVDESTHILEDAAEQAERALRGGTRPPGRAARKPAPKRTPKASRKDSP